MKKKLYFYVEKFTFQNEASIQVYSRPYGTSESMQRALLLETEIDLPDITQEEMKGMLEGTYEESLEAKRDSLLAQLSEVEKEITECKN